MTLRERLDKVEARIVGVLIEKELTTPDGYPLSLNALQNGCNQKSNRDPMLSLDVQSIEEAMTRLRLHRLVREVHEAGARVVKFAHEAKAVLEVDTPALAVLAELLMRGPQTPGELRGRVARMTPMATLDDLQRVLDLLAKRGMVQLIAPAPGSRTARWLQTLAPGIHPGIDAGSARPAGAMPAPASAPVAGPTHTVQVTPTSQTSSAPTAPSPASPASPGHAAPTSSASETSRPSAPSATPSAPGASAADVARLTERIDSLERIVTRLEQELRDFRGQFG